MLAENNLAGGLVAAAALEVGPVVDRERPLRKAPVLLDRSVGAVEEEDGLVYGPRIGVNIGAAEFERDIDQ